jgi:alpha-N-arabinofuranosidase
MIFLAVAAAGFAADEIALTIEPDAVVNRIDEKVYGHFLEHIYHSVNGGLWERRLQSRLESDNHRAVRNGHRLLVHSPL